MYVDAQTLLSDAQALTATAVSTNTYDTDSATNDVGPGEVLVVMFTVDVAADATTGDETYAFNVIESAAANLGSATVLNTRTIARATLVAGYKFALAIPSKVLRYLGASYTLGGTTPTITVTAWITAMDLVQAEKYYPDAITVS
jgi:hypothetical protein